MLVVGGAIEDDDADDGAQSLQTAELWDPAAGAWVVLPPMSHKRAFPGCCVLPSGRVAVVGGRPATYETCRDAEAFDPVARTWEPLPPMSHDREHPGVAAVAGGLVVVGSDGHWGEAPDEVFDPDELFDEASGRWFELPHRMAQPRTSAHLVSLPAAAFAAPAAAGAAAQ